MTSTGTSSPVLHGGRRASARLRDGVVLLETGGVRRRIPVAAIERVDVHGAGGRRLTVVLTGGGDVAYHLRCRSAPAVEAFAHAVRRALPVRDAGEPRPDGAALVTEEPLERAAPNRVRRLWWAAGSGYVLGLVLLPVTDSGAAVVILWVAAPAAIAGGVVGVGAGGKMVRETWVLRTRGISVEGRLQRSRRGEDGSSLYTYAYVDGKGVRRELTSSDGGERADITYDPADPGTAEIGRRSPGLLVFGAALMLLFAPFLLAGVAFVVVGVVALVV